MAEIKLVSLNLKNKAECTEFIKFVNRHYVIPQKTIPFTKETLRKADYYFFWAYLKSSNKKMGTAGFYKKTQTLAETVKVVLDPKYRGQGYGAALSQTIEDAVKQRGFKKVMTTIYTNNLSMIIIKLKQGYRIEGFHPDHEAPGLDEYSLGKLL